MTRKEAKALTLGDFEEAIANSCFENLVIARYPTCKYVLLEANYSGFDFVHDAEIREDPQTGMFEIVWVGELHDAIEDALDQNENSEEAATEKPSV